MSSRRDEDKALEDHQQALHSYLDALLREVPDEIEGEPLPAMSPAPLPAQPRQQQRIPVAPAAERPAPLQPGVLMPLVARQLEESAVQAPVREAEQVPAVEAERAAPTVPAWGQARFQCLLFKVAGIALAVPLVKLNGVINWSDDITPMPGHSEKFLGLLQRLGQNVKVIDTAQVILPENMQQQVLAPVEERLHNILIMEEGEWGLACDGIGEVISLEPTDVKWRTSQGKRPWLAGTVTQHLCALLDTDAFAQMLKGG